MLKAQWLMISMQQREVNLLIAASSLTCALSLDLVRLFSGSSSLPLPLGGDSG